MKSFAKPIEPRPTSASLCWVIRTSAGVGQSGAVVVHSGRLRLTTTPLWTRRAALATRSAVSRFIAPRSSSGPHRPQLCTDSNSVANSAAVTSALAGTSRSSTREVLADPSSARILPSGHPPLHDQRDRATDYYDVHTLK